MSLSPNDNCSCRISLHIWLQFNYTNSPLKRLIVCFNGYFTDDSSATSMVGWVCKRVNGRLLQKVIYLHRSVDQNSSEKMILQECLSRDFSGRCNACL